MARKVLVTTTYVLPFDNSIDAKSPYFLVSSKNTDAYFKNQGIDIKEYLLNYDKGYYGRQTYSRIQQTVSSDDVNYPILKRIVNDDFYVYAALCLDKTLGGFGDEISHNFLSSIINDVKEDCHGGEIVLLACHRDIVRKEKTGEVPIDELKGDLRGLVKSVYSFVHEDTDSNYKSIVSKLSDSDLELFANKTFFQDWTVKFNDMGENDYHMDMSGILSKVSREDKVKLAGDFSTLPVILRALSREDDKEISEAALKTLRIFPQIERAVYNYLKSSGDEQAAAECCGVLKDCGLAEEKVVELFSQAEVCRQSSQLLESMLYGQSRGKGIA